MLISLTGVGSGFLVIAGFLNRKYFDGWIAIFFTTSILTTVTGFAFPFDRLLRSHILGLLSLLALNIALFLQNVFGLGGWRRAAYVVTIATTLYFNCFAAVVQLFAKIPALKAIAPTQTEPAFLSAQCLVLAIFVVLTYVAAMRFRVVVIRTT
jgi:uncharacterized membrane-anchored protein YitT (DUF2179 family)